MLGYDIKQSAVQVVGGGIKAEGDVGVPMAIEPLEEAVYPISKASAGPII